MHGSAMTAYRYTCAMGERDDQDPPARERAASGRVAQRRRTRAAIVAATRQLVADGKTPSIDDIAAAADVSRRTIYLYFPTVDQLLLDAAAGLLAETAIEEALDPDRHGDDVLARADGLARAMVQTAPEALPLGRKIIKLTVDAPQPADG